MVPELALQSFIFHVVAALLWILYLVRGVFELVGLG